MRGKDGEHTRHFHTRHERERHTFATLLQAFGSCHLHGLVFRHKHTRVVAAEHQDARAKDAHHRCYTDAGEGKAHVATLQQIPRTDADDEDGTRHPSARHGVEELDDGHGVGHQRPEIHHLVTHRVGVELHTHGALHPCIGNENPHRRDAGTDARHPCGEQVGTLAHLVPSEEHDGEERGLHEECQDALDGERSAEDVAHEPRIVTPIRTELELQDDARGDAHGKVDGKEFHPELGGTFPELVFLNHVKGFHGCHNHRQPEGERHENPMVTGGEGELRPRPID